MSEEWLTFGEAVEIARMHLGASIGRSQAVINAARASGEVRVHNPANPTLLMADDGVVGMGMRPGAQHKAGVTADGKMIVRSTVSTSTCHINSDDLLDWLSRQHPEKKPASTSPPSAHRTGRPPAYDWAAVRKTTFELMDHHDEFSVDDPEWNAQARLEEILSEKFGMAISTLREQLPKFLTDWRKLKVGN
jgi:hypothetical protein